MGIIGSRLKEKRKCSIPKLWYKLWMPRLYRRNDMLLQSNNYTVNVRLVKSIIFKKNYCLSV